MENEDKLNFTKIKTEDDHTLVHHDSMKKFFKMEEVEKIKNAKYMGEFTVKNPSGSWANIPVSVFYQEKAHPEGSNYFGLFFEPLRGHLMITDAKSVAEHKWIGVLNEKTKEILYSAYRHDFQTYEEMMIDGGPEYTKSYPNAKLVEFYLEKDKIKVDGV